jgi:hypothetical protein
VSIIVTSSTDNAEAINQAASAGGDELVVAAESDPKGASQHDSTALVIEGVGKGGVASTSDNAAAVREAAENLVDDQEERRETQRPGKTRARLLRRLSRLHSEVEERDQEIARLRAQYEPAAQPRAEARPESNADGQQWQRPQQQQPVDPQQQAIEAFRQGEARLPEQVKQAKERYPDFDESLKKCDAEYPVPALAYLHLVSHVENPAETAYWLSKNPQAVARLWILQSSPQPERMLGELNNISYMLRHGNGTAPTRPQPRTSAAPAPIKPVGSGSARSSADPSTMSFREFKAWREAGGGRR